MLNNMKLLWIYAINILYVGVCDIIKKGVNMHLYMEGEFLNTNELYTHHQKTCFY